MINTATLKQNAPEIKIWLGVAGLIASIFLCGRAAVKAHDVIVEEEEKLERPLTTGEKFKKAIPHFVPTIIVAGASVVSIGFGMKGVKERTTALVSAASLSASALKEYKEEVKQQLGEGKTKKIEDAIAQKKVNENPPPNDISSLPGKGAMLFYEPLSNSYFMSDVQTVYDAMNSANADMVKDMWVSENDWLGYLGLNAGINGEALGWRVDKHLIDISIKDASFASVRNAAAPDGTPCHVICYAYPPESDYMNLR